MWVGQKRKKELPPGWGELRLRVLKRDGYACRICGRKANQVDHIDQSQRFNHSMSNLQSLCTKCHSEKTSKEATAGRVAAYSKRFAPTEEHKTK